MLGKQRENVLAAAAALCPGETVLGAFFVQAANMASAAIIAFGLVVVVGIAAGAVGAFAGPLGGAIVGAVLGLIAAIWVMRRAKPYTVAVTNKSVIIFENAGSLPPGVPSRVLDRFPQDHMPQPNREMQQRFRIGTWDLDLPLPEQDEARRLWQLIAQA